MINIEFIKCHGSGNDFVMIDAIKYPRYSKLDYSKLAVAVSDREGEIGSDGLLVLCKHNDLFEMRMFNSDGSEAQMCGNGLRCIARLIQEHDGAVGHDVYVHGKYYKTRLESEIYEGVPTFSAEIDLTVDRDTVPVNLDYEIIDQPIPTFFQNINFTALSLGNPHIVANVNKIDRNLLEQVGIETEKRADLFPERINVSFFRRVGKNAIFVQTYERGVGLTDSCGTAMTASSTAATILGLTENNSKIDVFNIGGKVICTPLIDSNNLKTRLTGNATYQFLGKIECDINYNILSIKKEDSDYLAENCSYDKFVKEVCDTL